MSKPQVGWWYFFCCEDDLAQIESEQELADLLECDKERAEDGINPHSYFPTREEALAAGRKVTVL